MAILQMRKLRHRENEMIIQNVDREALNKQTCEPVKSHNCLLIYRRISIFVSSPASVLQNMVYPRRLYSSLLPGAESSAEGVPRALSHLALALVMPTPAPDHSESWADGRPSQHKGRHSQGMEPVVWAHSFVRCSGRPTVCRRL